MAGYETQELWYGLSFIGTETGKSDEGEKRRKDVRKLKTGILSALLAEVDGCRRAPSDPSATEHGNTNEVRLPLLIIEREMGSSEVFLECRVRINLCSPNGHYCTKIWVIIGSDNGQDSRGLQEFFGSIEEVAASIMKVIERVIRQETTILSSTQGEITAYPITIRNVGGNGKGPMKDVFRLFETDEEEEAATLLEGQETRDVVNDLLELNDKPVDQKLSIEQMKAMGILWRLMKNYSHLGATNFVYACDFRHDYARIAGFSDVDRLDDLHMLFRPKVRQIMYGL
jgi:hypothetical protein